jgi:hypothetical protein
MQTNDELLAQRDRLSVIAKAHFGQFLTIGLGSKNKPDLLVFTESELPQEKLKAFLKGDAFKNDLFEGKSTVEFITAGRAFA